MVYACTKPRVPVAASYTGPGPAYAMPPLIGQTQHDPRSGRVRGPAYHFGQAYSAAVGSSGPGPAYKIDAKLYRDGKEHTPACSLVGRRREEIPEKSPGPLSYSVDSQYMAASKHSRAPAYSFGLKFRGLDTGNTPGPVEYVFPSDRSHRVSPHRRAPSHAITGRDNDNVNVSDDKFPGPGNYNTVQVNHYMARQPAYPLTGRNFMPADKTQKPGPATHSPEKVWIHKTTPPRFSFGVRHSDYEVPFICAVDIY